MIETYLTEEEYNLIMKRRKKNTLTDEQVKLIADEWNKTAERLYELNKKIYIATLSNPDNLEKFNKAVKMEVIEDIEEMLDCYYGNDN